MKRTVAAWLAVFAVLMVGCSKAKPQAPSSAPVSVPTASEPAPQPAPEPAPAPGPTPEQPGSVPIAETAQGALAKVLQRPDVQVYKNQTGDAFTHDVAIANDDYFRVLIGERKGDAPVWTRRYLVHKGGGPLLLEEVWPPAQPVATPVSQKQALALVEGLEPAQKLKFKLGDSYTTDVVVNPDGSWRVMLGTYRKGLGFDWQDRYIVDPKTGIVSQTSVLAE